MQPPANPTWFEHVDLMQILIAALFLMVAWFIVRTLRQIDRNQTELFERQVQLERDFYELRGEHRSHHRWHGEERRRND